MKNIIKSLVIVVAVAAIAGGATYAYFTASNTVAGNTFSTGSMAFDLRTGVDTDHLPFNFTKMLPGAWVEDEVTLFNHSDSSEMKYRLYATPTSGDPTPFDKVWFEAYRCNNFDSGSLCASWPASPNAQGWLTDFDGTTVAKSIVSPATINPNNSHVWKFRFVLDTSAGNSYQNKTATFDLVGQGTQPTNPGWSE